MNANLSQNLSSSPNNSRSIRRRRQNAAGNGTLMAGTGAGGGGDTLSVNNEGIVVAAGKSNLAFAAYSMNPVICLLIATWPWVKLTQPRVYLFNVYCKNYSRCRARLFLSGVNLPPPFSDRRGIT